MISRVGDDQLGKEALKKIWNLGLTLEYIQNDSIHPTGTVDIFFDKDMNPDFTINREVAYDYIEFSDKIAELVKSSDCFCYGTLAQRNQTSKDSLNKMIELLNDAVCLYDINLRKDCYTAGNIIESLKYATVVKLNDDEALELKELLAIPYSGLDDIGKAIIEKYGIDVCLITLGENGVLAISESGDIGYFPGYKVKLADPLGAGDAFSAGFIHSWLQNKNLTKACNLGNILGAITATQKGATVPIPQKAIDSFQSKTTERNLIGSLEKHIN
jgi:fructokinase